MNYVSVCSSKNAKKLHKYKLISKQINQIHTKKKKYLDFACQQNRNQAREKQMVEQKSDLTFRHQKNHHKFSSKHR